MGIITVVVRRRDGRICQGYPFVRRVKQKVFKCLNVPSGRLWHGVVAAATPGVTAKNALERQPEALQRTVFSESLEGIL